MNKHIIVTSFALVLTMTVVLAVGKTDGTAELNLSDSAAPRLELENDVNEQILVRDISVPIQNISGAIIRSEIDEGDMILGQELPEEHRADDALSSLMESLARVQEALKTLEQIAESTEQIVVVMEERKAAQ